MVLLPPALFKKGEEGRKKKKKEVLHLSRCYTHIIIYIYVCVYALLLSEIRLFWLPWTFKSWPSKVVLHGLHVCVLNMLVPA